MTTASANSANAADSSDSVGTARGIAAAPSPAIRVQGLTMAWGERVIQRDLAFDVARGARFVVMGESGCGKSTLLKHMIGLVEPAAGRVLYCDAQDGDLDFWALDAEGRQRLSRRFGVLYQSGALWSSMTVADNVALPLEQYTDFEPERIDELVRLKLALVGLADAADRFPSELSGGMRKRAGLARAMALDPQILFLDEPSAGLDPISSRLLDELILEIGESLGTTFVIVSHELASIFTIATDSVYLDADTRTQLDVGPPQRLAHASRHQKVRRFLNRGDEPEGEIAAPAQAARVAAAPVGAGSDAAAPISAAPVAAAGAATVSRETPA